MTDATSQASHAHDLAGGHARIHARRPARPSPLEASAAARLLGVSIALSALWAGVYWALH